MAGSARRPAGDPRRERRTAEGKAILVSLPAGGCGAGAPASAPPCDRCEARCCRYFALEIDRPVTPEDHEKVRWYLVHEGTSVWVDEGRWFLEMRNACRHLGADSACRIYENRPRICREYGAPPSPDRCEFFEEDLAFDLRFDDAEAFDAWSREVLRMRERRLRGRREARARRAGRPTEAIA